MIETNWGNLYDYMTWRGDLTFTASPFNIIDGLIFAALTHVNFCKIEEGDQMLLPKAVAELKKIPETERFSGLGMMREKTLDLLDEAAKSARFRGIAITGTTSVLCEASEEQFSAVTFLLPDDTMFIAFRGTDNTLVGWKEDFNMAFMKATPSQREAAAYAQRIASLFDRPIRIGGHSKGGNLAIWAASFLPSDKKDRILQVCNYDGPGFLPEFIQSKGYQEIRNQILSFVPESSIVGVLMCHSDYLTVKSTNHTIMQHDPFSWKIAGKRFDYNIERSKSGRTLEKQINKLVGSLTPEEMADYVERVYATLKICNTKTLDDLQKNKLKHIFFTLPQLIKIHKKHPDKNLHVET